MSRRIFELNLKTSTALMDFRKIKWLLLSKIYVKHQANYYKIIVQVIKV